MKINDIKHNHSLTDLLKVGIFSILMCAPLIAIGSTCAYAIVNKNAVESYSANYNLTTQKVNITNNNQVISGNDYILKYNPNTAMNSPIYSSTYMYSAIDLDYAEYGWDTSITYVGIRFSNDGWIQLFDANNQKYIKYNLWGTTLKEVTLTLTGLNTGEEISQSGKVDAYCLLYQKQTLDNAFYYATEKMTQSDLFNWTENTAIYTGVSAMCTQLDIETNVIPILIVYWFILTIIYVIIDIVLKTFTTLTHMLSKETH